MCRQQRHRLVTLYTRKFCMWNEWYLYNPYHTYNHTFVYACTREWMPWSLSSSSSWWHVHSHRMCRSPIHLLFFFCRYCQLSTEKNADTDCCCCCRSYWLVKGCMHNLFCIYSLHSRYIRIIFMWTEHPRQLAVWHVLGMYYFVQLLQFISNGITCNKQHFIVQKTRFNARIGIMDED